MALVQPSFPLSTAGIILSQGSDYFRGALDTSFSSKRRFENEEVTFETGADSVATGDSTLDIYITYQIITL